VWTANQVSDTGRYVANMAPLIKDPAIQDALTGMLTNQIVTPDKCEAADRSGGRTDGKGALRS
jgi:hypothetical protein